MTASRRLSPRP